MDSDRKRKLSLQDEEGRHIKVQKVEKIHDNRLCKVYADKIYAFQLSEERKRNTKWDYMEEIQTEIDYLNRIEMVDMMFTLANNYTLASEVMHLGVSFLDRFLLSYKVTHHYNLAAISFSCLFLASKYVDSQCRFSISDVIFVEGLSENQVLQVEGVICESLQFEFWKPTTYTFLRKFVSIAVEDNEFGESQLELLSSCFGEMTLFYYGCLAHSPSQIAAAVVFLASFTLQKDKHPWSLTLQEEAEMIPKDFEKCALDLHGVFTTRRSEFVSVRTKYDEEKFKGVGFLVPPVKVPDDYFERVDR